MTTYRLFWACDFVITVVLLFHFDLVDCIYSDRTESMLSACIRDKTFEATSLVPRELYAGAEKLH